MALITPQQTIAMSITTTIHGQGGNDLFYVNVQTTAANDNDAGFYAQFKLAVAADALPDMRDRLVEKLESAKYSVADIEVAEIGEDILEIAAKLVATAVDPNELNAVATDLQHLPGVRHATWEVSTTD